MSCTIINETAEISPSLNLDLVSTVKLAIHDFDSQSIGNWYTIAPTGHTYIVCRGRWYSDNTLCSYFLPSLLLRFQFNTPERMQA